MKWTDVWATDTGATTEHVTHFKNVFVSFKAFGVPTYIHVGNRDVIKTYGQDDILVDMTTLMANVALIIWSMFGMHQIQVIIGFQSAGPWTQILCRQVWL